MIRLRVYLKSASSCEECSVQGLNPRQDKMLALLLLTTLIAPSFQAQVNVTLFYESLCPYSIRFITQQLYPTWTELTSEYLAVDFVPYGNAQQTLSTDGQWSFTCQHGPNECVGNIVQACALRTLREQPDQQMEFINCVMASEDPSTGGQECAKTLNIDYAPISACSDSQEGNILLSGLGNQTHAFKPTVNHVPYVVLEGVYNSADEEKALVDLKSLICNLLEDTKPSSCKVPSL